MNYRVALALEAKAQLDAIYDYIAAEASPDTARRYTDAIIDKCHSLKTSPNAVLHAMTSERACAPSPSAAA